LNLQFLASAEAAKSNAYQFHYGQTIIRGSIPVGLELMEFILAKIRFVIESIQYTHLSLDQIVQYGRVGVAFGHVRVACQLPF